MNYIHSINHCEAPSCGDGTLRWDPAKIDVCFYTDPLNATMKVYQERCVVVKGHQVRFYTALTDEEAIYELHELVRNGRIRVGDLQFAVSLLNERMPSSKQRDWIQRLVNEYEVTYMGYQLLESKPGLEVFEKCTFHRRGRGSVPGSHFYIATGQLDVVRNWIADFYNQYDPRGYGTSFRLHCVTDGTYAMFVGNRSHSCE